MMQFNVEEMFKVPAVPKAANGQRKNPSSKNKGRKRKYSVTFNEGKFTGKLFYHQADPEAMKCLIAANMSGCLAGDKMVKTESGLSIKAIMTPYWKGGSKQLKLKIMENNANDSEQTPVLELKNPFTISWIIYRLSEDHFEKQSQASASNNGMRSRTSSISSNQGRSRTFSSSSEYFPFSEIVQAQIMQWNDFTCSEIKPFVSAITNNKRLDPATRGDASNSLLRRRLSTALDVLNGVLEKKTFLMGNRCTLADICVAVDLIPIVDSEISSNWPELAKMQKEFVKEHHVYLKKWFTNVLNMPFVIPIRKRMNCFLSPESKLSTPNSKGDAKVRKNLEKGDKMKTTIPKIMTNGHEETSKKEALKIKRKKLLEAKEKEKKALETKNKEKKLKEELKLRIIAAKEKSAKKFESAKSAYESLGKLPALKILALHDYRQNEQEFKAMVKPLMELLGKDVEFTFANAPNIPLAHSASDISQNLRGWWFSSNSDSYDRHSESEFCKGFEASVSSLVEIVQSEGPFDGIMGLSQGAALAGMICLDSVVYNTCVKVSNADNSLSYDRLFPPELGAFKFAILCSGFCSQSNAHVKVYDKINEIRNLGKEESLEECTIPVLHVVGSQGRVVKLKESKKLASLFGKKLNQYLDYPGGRYIPCRSESQKTGYYKFFSKMKQVCYGDVELSEGMEKMALSNPVTQQEDTAADKVSKPLAPKSGVGADHPVIRAIQDP